MSQNNAHLNETKEKRTKRFEDGPPLEIIETILNSIHTKFFNEIRVTLTDQSNPQTSLMILGAHSAALTIAHGFFDQGGSQGYRLFLENFVDGCTPDTKFSAIADEIHQWRNVIAHRWINVAGHNISYDFSIPEGWKREGDLIIFNPEIYLNHFLDAFEGNRKIFKYDQILVNDQMMEGAKQRFLSKYVEPA